MTRYLIVLMVFTIIGTVAKSQTQSDTSDTYWEVVLPIAESQHVDMGSVIVGDNRDSVVNGFIKNTGSWKFRVDSIYFRGGDASAFSLVSGFPKYEVAASADHAAEFHFKPTSVRDYTAEIVIITQADTIVKNIFGKGIQPQLEITTNMLDFGKIEIGNERTIGDTILIKNISTSAITIINTIKMSPDI